MSNNLVRSIPVPLWKATSEPSWMQIQDRESKTSPALQYMLVHAMVATARQVVSIFQRVNNKNASTIHYQKRLKPLIVLELTGGWEFMTLCVNTTSRCQSIL